MGIAGAGTTLGKEIFGAMGAGAGGAGTIGFIGGICVGAIGAGATLGVGVGFAMTGAGGAGGLICRASTFEGGGGVFEIVACCSCSFSKEANASATLSGDGTMGTGERPEGSFVGSPFLISVFSSATVIFTQSVLCEMQNQDLPL